MCHLQMILDDRSDQFEAFPSRLELFPQTQAEVFVGFRESVPEGSVFVFAVSRIGHIEGIFHSVVFEYPFEPLKPAAVENYAIGDAFNFNQIEGLMVLDQAVFEYPGIDTVLFAAVHPEIFGRV